MGNFSRLNYVLGWIVFGIATTVFVLTLEPTASYWDCGEFIAVSYKLEVPHPPGAPLFLMIGRLFSFLALGDVTQVAYWINFISALSSGFAVLFLFWSIAMLGRKLLGIKKGEETTSQGIILAGASAVGMRSVRIIEEGIATPLTSGLKITAKPDYEISKLTQLIDIVESINGA